MVVKAKISDLDEWLFIEDVPDVYSPNNTLAEKQITIQRSPVQMANYQLTTGGMFLMHAVMMFDESTSIHTDINGETITSHFMFYKNASGKKVSASSHGNSRHNIRYIPSTVANHELSAKVEYTYFMVVLSKAYYFSLIDRHSILHERFVKDIENGQFTSFSNEDMAVTPEMRKVINEIRDCRHSGELKRLHTESKILELLMYQLEQLRNDTGMSKQDIFKSGDFERLEKARTILNERFVTPPTHKELAKEILLNEFKLRTGFKEYFGVTMYDYITRLRMEQARRLLLDDKMSIYEVSGMSGFKHQANFSKAFKKYFGILPSGVKV
ncbi:helix-turn-helix transcriptional regulator [Pedobacter sp. AW31-3R]|uniref:AraC family transcriptional regulator n=1 Tax=Pedobacter sp. AW31-3R TaxID=3445781 RepID=UPI003FA0A19A